MASSSKKTSPAAPPAGRKAAPAAKTAPKKQPAAKQATATAEPKRAAGKSTATSNGKPAPAKTASKQAAAKAAPKKQAAPKQGAATAEPKRAAPAAKVAPKKQAAPKKHEGTTAAPKRVAAKQVAAKAAPKKQAAPAAKAAPPKPVKKAPSKDGIVSTKDFDLAFLRAQRLALLEERARLVGQAENLEHEAASLIEEAEMGDVQFDDESGEGDTMVVERERDLTLSAQARQIVAEIDAALARFADGTYGYSVVSGRPIPRERLEAIPWATELVDEKVGWIGRR
jgi:RNA polymerase-binding transcription factor DksA